MAGSMAIVLKSLFHRHRRAGSGREQRLQRPEAIEAARRRLAGLLYHVIMGGSNPFNHGILPFVV